MENNIANMVVDNNHIENPKYINHCLLSNGTASHIVDVK